MSRKTELKIGAMAPDFALPTDSGTIFKLSAHRGHPVILFFYPQDDTEGCTIENRQFSELAGEFAALGVSLLGISPDSVASHCAFRDKYELSAPLAADPDRTAIEAFGVWGEKTTFGHHHIGLIRTTFLVNSEGRIAEIFKVTRIKGHAANVLESARKLLA